MKKKALSLALALILCLTLAAPALAADSDFVIEDGVLTKYNGPGGNVAVPDGVTSIGDRAFFYCDSLTGVTIPDSVTNIGYWAFAGCNSLTGVTIPASVTSIGDGAFLRCSSLIAIQIDEGNRNYCSVDGVLFTKDMKTLAAYPGGKQGAYSIPDGVANIGYSAFENCTSLTGVTIPNSVTGIGDRAFYGCIGLIGVTIPGSVTSIGEEAFSGCSGLTGVIIPSGVTSIGNFVFYECDSLTSVTIPGSVTTIGNSAFYGTGLTSVTIPGSVTCIETGAFMNCVSLTSVTIPSSVTSIGEGAFRICVSLTDVYYGGTEAQWKKIKIGDNNDSLLNANIHYNSTGPDAPATTDFDDVPADAWYAAPVAWAVQKGITNGTGNNKFSPDKTCSTAEILTFLWRACGQPKADAAGGFNDVAADAWYADAAAWAKSKGMVTGSKLSPETPCTRASAVMFIWQAMGKPKASSPASFKDVPANSAYADAVAWAVEKGVTNGTGADTFSPDTICTRGHIVTFLNRAFA